MSSHVIHDKNGGKVTRNQTHQVSSSASAIWRAYVTQQKLVRDLTEFMSTLLLDPFFYHEDLFKNKRAGDLGPPAILN